MDTLDRLILGELANQCRISFSKLAEKYKVSLNTIKNRVEALVEMGIISNFVVELPLETLNASFAVIILDIKTDTSKEQLISLGKHPFIMALGLGYELQGFAVVVYRTNAELGQSIDFLQSSNLVTQARALPLIAPPSTIDTTLTRGLDTLKKIDWKILKSLRWNGRKPLGELASDVGVSVPTVRKRLAYLRKYNLIHETIQINPAASERDLVVMLLVRSSDTTHDYYELDSRFRKQWPENYWMFYRSASEMELMITFVVESSKSVATLRNEMTKVIENSEIIDQVIVPEWLFFPDFRDELIDAYLN
ncbi:MAG: winged helix-turn-helix transcriptional regulator [Candidatus Sifarchaeia archaeon]